MNIDFRYCIRVYVMMNLDRERYISREGTPASNYVESYKNDSPLSNLLYWKIPDGPVVSLKGTAESNKF